MADEITIGTKAIKEVQDLRAELIKLSQDALKAGKDISTISTPGMLNKSGSDNAKAGSDLDAFKTKYVALSEAIQKGAEKSRLAEIRLQQQREKAFDSFDRKAKKEQAQLDKTNSAYNRTQSQINTLTRAYNDLAVKKERYNNLSSYEEGRLNTLQKVTEKYNGTLKTVDSQIGKNQRNVGNYASGWNGLGNSINQLTREAPAFAVSLNTGFLALSNNIPILTDEIGKLITINKDLIAQGKPVKSVFSQILSSIFSLQSAISLGVLLLTLYGGKITEWIGNLISGSKAINVLKESQKQLNAISLEGQKNAVQETLKVKSLLEIAKDTTLTYKERMIAVKELQETYPAYFENLSKEQILAGNTAQAEKSLTEAILSRAKAQAATSKITENQSQIIDLEEEKLKISKQLTRAELELASAKKLTGQVSGGTVPGTYDPEFIAINKVASARRGLQSVQEKINALNEINNRLTSYAIEKQKESILLDYKEDKIKKTKKEKQEDLDYFNSYIKAQGTVNEQIDVAIDKLETQAILTRGNNELYPIAISLLDQLKKVKKDLNDSPDANVKILGVPEAKEQLKQLSEEAKKFADSFLYEFGNNAGFKDTFKILRDEMKGFGEDWKTTFLGVAEIAQETFNFVSQLTTKNFDSEKERLQNQYDVSLKYAGDNKEAQAKLAEDLEKQKRDIATREAKAKKKQALVNIAIDTAQAIIGLWANPGFPVAIPLAILVGGLGLAQAAIVNATEIPQYYMGGTHEGGKMMINDGSGANWKETFVTPDGKAHQASGKNVIVDAPAGTEIYTHDQWLDRQREASLNNMLKYNNIDRYIPAQQQIGMTKDDFYEVMSNTLGGQVIERSNLDANGFSKYTIKRGNITRRNISRANGKSSI